MCKRHYLKEHLGILPGWNWLEDHEHDLDGWEPQVELDFGSYRQTMRLKKPETLKEVIKANK